MEEMHRTHKEPVWGWVAVAAEMIAKSRRPQSGATTHAPVRPAFNKAGSVVTPWSPRSPAGWSA